MNFKQSNIQEKIFAGILVIGLLYLLKEVGGLKYQISLLFFISAFILALLNREEYAIYSLIFVLPFRAAPFHNSEFPILFGLSAFIIIGIFLGRLVKNSVFTNSNQDNFKEILLIKKWILFFLFLSTVLPLFSETYNPFVHAEMQYSYVNFICYIVILILFIDIMPKDVTVIEKLILMFNLSVFLQLLSYVAMKLNLSMVPKFLIASPVADISYYRFSGLVGDYELVVDYFMMVIGFSSWFIYNNKHKTISFITLITAIVLGIITGTRSFLIVFILFLMVNTILILSKATVLKSKIVTVILLLGLIVFFFNLNFFVGKIDVFQTMYNRTLQTMTLLQGHSIDIERFANRKWSEALPIVIEKAGFLGHGAFLSSHFYDHVMVPHCIYFDVYSKFGVIGLLLLIILFINILKMSYKIAKNPNMSKPKEFIFFSLVITLAVQQLKISALRSVNSILIYAFLFMVIYVLYKNPRKLEFEN
jgi:hypothetical protein